MANSSNRLESQPNELRNAKILPLTPIKGHGDINYINYILDVSLKPTLLIIYLYIFRVLKIVLKLLELRLGLL